MRNRMTREGRLRKPSRQEWPGFLGRLIPESTWRTLQRHSNSGMDPRTRRNEKALGQSGRDKSHPQWWVTRLIHLPTPMMWDWRQGPDTSSERQHLREMIPSMPKGSLLVGDIGFGGFDQLWKLSNAKIAFLIRCGGGTTRLLVDQSRAQIERKGDVRDVYLWPLNRRRKTPLRLRLIVFKNRGKRVYLLTNVLKPTRLPRRVAGEFYRARWDIEVAYRGLKQTMGHRKVLARTPEPGGMELAANLVAMALLLLYAALVQQASVIRLSLAQALRVIRWGIEALRHNESCGAMWAQLAHAVIDDYRRDTSKRARDWPHKKNEKPPKPPKLHRMDKEEKTRIQRLCMVHSTVSS